MSVPPPHPPQGDPLPRGLVLGRHGALPVVLTLPWLVLNLALLVVGTRTLARLLGDQVQPAHALVAACLWLALTGAVAVHEWAHASVARSLGHPPTHVAFTLTGAHTGVPPHGETPRVTARIALAGPLANLALALPTLVVAGAATLLVRGMLVAPLSTGEGVVGVLAWPATLTDLHRPWQVLVLELLGWLALMVGGANLVMGLTNLLPGAPLDGGAVLRAWVWRRTGSARAGHVAAARGGVALAVAGTVLVLTVPWWSGWSPPPVLTVLAVAALAAGAAPHVALLWGRPPRL